MNTSNAGERQLPKKPIPGVEATAQGHPGGQPRLEEDAQKTPEVRRAAWEGKWNGAHKAGCKSPAGGLCEPLMKWRRDPKAACWPPDAGFSGTSRGLGGAGGEPRAGSHAYCSLHAQCEGEEPLSPKWAPNQDLRQSPASSSTFTSTDLSCLVGKRRTKIPASHSRHHMNHGCQETLQKRECFSLLLSFSMLSEILITLSRDTLVAAKPVARKSEHL